MHSHDNASAILNAETAVNVGGVGAWKQVCGIYSYSNILSHMTTMTATAL